MVYVEKFCGVDGVWRWRAVDVRTRQEAVADTRDQAVAALASRMRGCQLPRCPECGGKLLWDAWRQEFYCDACWGLGRA